MGSDARPGRWPLAVIFDLDGTLIDSAEDVRAALNRALAAVGRGEVASDRMPSLIGHGARPMIENALRATGDAGTAELIEQVLSRYTANYLAAPAALTTVFPGARETLSMLRDAGIKLGVCTNKPERLTQAVLRALNLLEQFASVLGGDSLPVRKPDPEHLWATLRPLGVSPSHAVYVGDSAVDVATARSAGIPVILVEHGYAAESARSLGGDAVISSLSALSATFSRLGARAAVE
jgi:phosphoglycolate phosphatase